MTLEDSLKALGINSKISKEGLAQIINGNNFTLFSGLLSHPDIDPDLKSQLQGALSEFNPQNQHKQKPAIFYIAENDHGDMTYSSLLKQMIEDCDSKDLKIKVFSEFPNQTDKVKTQQLKNVPAESIIHNETTELLDARMIPMGDLKARYNKLFPESWNSYSEDLTPSQLFENYKDQIDNSEVLELMEEEIKSRIEKEAIFTKNADLRIIGEGNSSGKENGGDLHSFNRLRTSFHFKQIHSEMASDVEAGLDGDEDVVIMIAGTPHIPGLNQELESKFQDSRKLVIGNFQERSQDGDHALATLGKKSCPSVGEVVGFQVDPMTNQALIPFKIRSRIERVVQEKAISKQDQYKLEKGLHESISQGGGVDQDDKDNKFYSNLGNIGDFYGKIDADGKPLRGAFRYNVDFDYVSSEQFIPREEEKPWGTHLVNSEDKIPSGATFVGTFVDGKPSGGQYSWPDMVVEIDANLESNTREITKKSPQTLEWQKEHFIGQKKVGEEFFSATHKYSTNNERFSKFVNYIKPITSPDSSAPFNATIANFRDLRDQHHAIYSSTIENLTPALQDKMRSLESDLKNELDEGKLPISSTAILELSGVKTQEEKDYLDRTIKGFNRLRFGEEIPDFARDDFENFPYDPNYGNCLEYARNTQTKAIEQGLPQTFVIWANPNHVFNVAVDGDKMLLVDHWNGDLICEFTSENFHEHSSLHGIYDLRLHDCNWQGGSLNGPMNPDDEATKIAQSKLEDKITEIQEGRFSPEIQGVIFDRVSSKIASLDPNDLYFQENSKELKHLIDHFGLSETKDLKTRVTLEEQLLNKFCEEYDLSGFAATNAINNESGIWHIAENLFCQNRGEEAMLAEIQERVSSNLINQRVSSINSPNLDEDESFVKKLGLEKTSKPESYVERMQAGKYGNIGSKGGAHEL